MYTPSENLTVDEQLLEFRGKCPFRMYIPNKPAKYGIKLVFANDNRSKYLLRAIPYLGKKGKTTEATKLGLGHFFTKKLTKPYHFTNRNVTTDNWFTSVNLVEDLKNNCGMTLVGTIRGNKKEIPIEMKTTSNRSHGSSAFLFTKDLTLVSYMPSTTKSKKKLVYLTSSMHFTPTLSEDGKPEILKYYNSTKGGVDAFDQMCSQYSCSRRKRRWPLCVFYGMLNATAINSYIIFSENAVKKGIRPKARRFFLTNLALQLIAPWAKQRLTNPTMPIAIKSLICTVHKLEMGTTHTKNDSWKNIDESSYCKKKCGKCSKDYIRKSKYICTICNVHLCFKHIYIMCLSCLKKQNE